MTDLMLDEQVLDQLLKRLYIGERMWVPEVLKEISPEHADLSLLFAAKLVGDGYAHPSLSNEYELMISVKGRILVREGGYETLRMAEATQKEHQRRQTELTLNQLQASISQSRWNKFFFIFNALFALLNLLILLWDKLVIN